MTLPETRPGHRANFGTGVAFRLAIQTEFCTGCFSAGFWEVIRVRRFTPEEGFGSVAGTDAGGSSSSDGGEGVRAHSAARELSEASR